MEGYGDNIGLGITFGVFLAYLLTRKIMEFIIRRKVRNSKTYEAACKAGLTFFSILTLVLLATGGIMSVLDTPADVVKSAMLWISACIYLIFILRKTQILISSASFFAAFLYLCALELIPTGALAASAITGPPDRRRRSGAPARCLPSNRQRGGLPPCGSAG